MGGCIAPFDLPLNAPCGDRSSVALCPMTVDAFGNNGSASDAPVQLCYCSTVRLVLLSGSDCMEIAGVGAIEDIPPSLFEFLTHTKKKNCISGI